MKYDIQIVNGKMEVYEIDTDKVIMILDNKKSNHSMIFDNADDMMKFVEGNNDYFIGWFNIERFDVVGFEIFGEHYIKLYYNISSSNS